MRWIFGPILIILCVLLMKFTVQVTEVTGKVGFAEKYLGPPLAGTYTWWRLVGLAGIVLNLLWMFGFLKFGF